MLGKRFVLIIATILLLLFILPACGGGGEEETLGPTGTVTTNPTATPSPTVGPTVTPTPTPSSGPVKLGIVHDWSGPWAISGLLYGDTLPQLMEKRVRDMGGILGGREVKFSKYDAGSTVPGALTASKKAFFEDHMPVLIWGGCNSVNSEVIAEFAEENQVLYVSYLILPYDISDLNFTVRSGYTIEDMDVQCEYALEVLKAKKVAILGRDLEESRSFAQRWSDMVKGSGGEVVYQDFPAMGTIDYTAQLTRIKYEKPDVLVTDLAMDSYATVAKQILDLGGWGNIKVVSNMAAVFQANKPGLEGTYVYAGWVPGLDNPGAKRFEQEFQAMYKKMPDGAAAMMGDDLWIAVKAIEMAGTDTDRVAIAKAARSGNLAWESTLGPVHIGTDGETHPKLGLLCQIVDGKLVPVPEWR